MPITGGAITGDYLCRNVNDRTFDIYGGTIGEGAYMSLFGAQNEGAFYLTAKKNSSQYASLIGSALGKLTWNSNDLSGAAIVAKNLATNGYIKFACGLILQWTVINEFGDNQVQINCKATKGFVISWPLDSYKLIYMATLTGYEHTVTGWIYGLDTGNVIIYNDGDTQGIRAHLVCIGYA